MRGPQPERTGSLIAINSGANMNFDRLRHVAERAEVGEAREILLAVSIPEEPGSYRRFIQVLGNRVVTEFNYRYAGGSKAHVFVGLRLANAKREKPEIIAQLKRLGYGVLDISADETAKLHVRYMVGGRVPGLSDEVVFRFEFPERPGALLKFLGEVGLSWNITLFHYRNHGADYGRVLVGVQVPDGERALLRGAPRHPGNYPMRTRRRMTPIACSLGAEKGASLVRPVTAFSLKIRNNLDAFC